MTNGRLTERPPLVLPGSLDVIRTIGEYVLDAAGAAGLEQTSSYRLRLAVEEIATNAVVHGYQWVQRPGNLSLTACCDGRRLIITCEDSGPAYDPRQTPLPDDLGRPLVERPEGGLGVYLALMGVDEYDYERVNDINRHIFMQYLDV